MSEKIFWVTGIHAVEAILRHTPERITRLCIAHDRNDQKIQTIVALAQNAKIAAQLITKVELDKLTELTHHQGVAAYCSKAKMLAEADLETLLAGKDKPFLLILDGIQDPHNLGACLRSADAAGVDAVIAPKDQSVGLTAAVCKVACGAAETVPYIQVTNLARTLRQLKARNIWIYGAAGEADHVLYTADLTGAVALIMGAEGKGLRRLTRDLCDHLLSLPMQGTVSSLNVSVATGIFLFEALRQRHVLGP